jgi:hypothetical protein
VTGSTPRNCQAPAYPLRRSPYPCDEDHDFNTGLICWEDSCRSSRRIVQLVETRALNRRNSQSPIVGSTPAVAITGFARFAERWVQLIALLCRRGRLGNQPAVCGHIRVRPSDSNADACLHTQNTSVTYGCSTGRGRFAINQRKCGLTSLRAQRAGLIAANAAISPEKPGWLQPVLVPPSAIRRTALRKTSISSKVL